MFSLWEHDHCDAVFQIPPCQTRGIPFAMCRSSSSIFRRAASALGQGDLRITVRASPSSASLRASHSSSASHHLVFLDELEVSSDRAGPAYRLGAPADDRMSIAASEGELGSVDDDSAAFPPPGRVALPESDPELTSLLSRAAERVRLNWRPPPSPKCSRLDDWFLGALAEHRQPPPVPFFPEEHEEVNRSWRAHFLPGTGLRY